MKKWISSLVLVFLFTAASLPVSAQDSIKSYSYPSIDVDYIINQDTTISVSESLAYSFIGQFNQGWRAVPHRGLDTITGISIIDASTHTQLVYSSNKLNKLDPNSWGKFTTYEDSNSSNVEWYYNLSDTTHTWIIKYTLHGAISFGQGLDRFYWNIFTDFSVPIESSTVSVTLPKPVAQNQVHQFAYKSPPSDIVQSYDANKGIFTFSSNDFPPYSKFSVDIDWPKGYIDRSLYWQGFLKNYFGYILAPTVLIICLLLGLFIWLKDEYLPQHNLTVIPIYEPPKKLPPAVAEVVAKEALTNKALTATIIDLAARGYLTITGLPPTFADKAGKWFLTILMVLIGSVFAVGGLALIISTQALAGLVFAAPVIFFILILTKAIKPSKNYKIEKTSKFKHNALKHFEKSFINLLMEGKDSFSTSDLKLVSTSRKRQLYEGIQNVRKEIVKQANSTKIYSIAPETENWKWVIWIGLLILGAVILFNIIGFLSLELRQTVFLLVSATISVTGLFTFIKFEARLNKAGQILKNEWRGFKLYLSVAEKVRIQNLTPDKFEKYLPYAMVFGVEDSWAKAFEGILKAPPSWYHGYSAGYLTSSHTTSGFSASNFSASSFSASFASSFSSAFASSGASGGGGAGGGGAGGGGGGGGGGAS